jgi:hypothetical protein
MVDSWRTFLQLEVLWFKFAPMDPWETLVFYAVMFSLALMVFTMQQGQGRASCSTLIFSLFFSVIRRHHAVHQLFRISAGCANQDWPPLPSSIVTSGKTKRRSTVDCSRPSWFSFVVNPMPTTIASPNFIWHTVMARNMPATAN